MKYKAYKCDVCGREITDQEDIIFMKAKSKSFVTYSNCDEFFADRRKYDVCKTCLQHIGAATRGYVDRDGKVKKPDYTPPPTRVADKIDGFYTKLAEEVIKDHIKIERTEQIDMYLMSFNDTPLAYIWRCGNYAEIYRIITNGGNRLETDKIRSL